VDAWRYRRRLVGALVVARLVNDSALSNEILTVAASAFGGHTDDK
jgi:hypothetical protein